MAKKKPQSENKAILSSLPDEVRAWLTSDKATDDFLELSEKYQLSLTRIRAISDIVTKVYGGKLSPSDLPAQVKAATKLKKTDSDVFTLTLTGQWLLVADTHLNGTVSKAIASWGGNPADFEQYIKDFKVTVARESKELKELEKEDVVAPSVAAEPPSGPSIEDFAISVDDPEEAIGEMILVLKSDVVKLLKSKLYELRIKFNIVMVTLMLDGEKYQKKLISALLTNEDILTSKKIVHKDEKIEPTIGNWLKDYITFIGLSEQRISSVKKAKYYSENPNVKQLNPEEREILDKVTDLYDNLHNFYFDSAKLPLSEIQVFSFTEAEQKDFIKKYSPKTHEEKVAAGEAGEADIYGQYIGAEEEDKAIEAAEVSIGEKTRKEYNKVAEVLYDYSLKRKKYEIIACINILAETGSLDNLVATDTRFSELLLGYFRRNNLMQEIEQYQRDPRDPDFVIYFLKYMFMERLGMTESNAARLGVQISNVFRTHGLSRLAQMAYYDITTQEFKWLMTPEEVSLGQEQK